MEAVCIFNIWLVVRHFVQDFSISKLFNPVWFSAAVISTKFVCYILSFIEVLFLVSSYSLLKCWNPFHFFYIFYFNALACFVSLSLNHLQYFFVNCAQEFSFVARIFLLPLFLVLFMFSLFCQCFSSFRNAWFVCNCLNKIFPRLKKDLF